MNKKLLLTIAIPFMLIGCQNKTNVDSYIQSESSKNDSSEISEGSSSSSDSISSESSSESSEPFSSSESSSVDDEDDESKIDYITLNKSELYLQIGKYEYLTVNFFPDIEDVDLKQGIWSIDNEDIASVSQYGKVTGKAKGDAYVSFETYEGHRRARCHVYVINSESDISKEWQKVNDMDSIKSGDTLVFASPELGVAASLERVSGYLRTAPISFSGNGDKITSLNSEVGTYYVGEGTDGALTLENQEGNYLAGKYTTSGGGLVFVHSKGQINWIFEHVESTGLDYCVNYDIEADLWLMFNKINSGDIRFNLYDSNPTSLMIMPTIYRLTVIYNV